jgi:hypothetical protein
VDHDTNVIGIVEGRSAALEGGITDGDMIAVGTTRRSALIRYR